MLSQLQRPVAAGCTSFHTMLGIGIDDVRLSCSCLDIETHSMKFRHKCFCAVPGKVWNSVTKSTGGQQQGVKKFNT